MDDIFLYASGGLGAQKDLGSTPRAPLLHVYVLFFSHTYTCVFLNAFGNMPF